MSDKFKTVIPGHTVERLMTDDEIRERAKEMNLNEEVVEFILSIFSNTRDWMEDDDCDLEEDDFARGDGRVGLGQSHQDVLYDLAGIMGCDDADEECLEARKVFDRFFAE